MDDYLEKYPEQVNEIFRALDKWDIQTLEIVLENAMKLGKKVQFVTNSDKLDFKYV
jgi:hypothetical protein